MEMLAPSPADPGAFTKHSVEQRTPAVSNPGSDHAGRGCRLDTHSHLGLPRIAIWAVSVGIALGLVVWGQPLGVGPLCLALSVMAGAAMAVERGREGVVFSTAVPAGFILVAFWALAWGLATGAAGMGAWDSQISSLSGLATFTGLTGWVVGRRGGVVGFRASDVPALAGFTLIAGFWMWVIATQPLALWSRINSTGTDFLRHLWMIREIREQGELSYGEISYPRAFHALGAWLSAALDTPVSANALWRVAAPIAMLMLGLVLMASMSAAAQLVAALGGNEVAGAAAAVVGAAAFVQTAWFSTFLNYGNVMNMLVGVAMVSLIAAGLQPRVVGSLSGTVVCASALAVTANSWQLLLPVVLLGSVPWILQFVRLGRRRPLDWAVWVAGSLVAIHGILGLRPNAQSISGAVQTAGIATVSSLFRPDWWWWGALLVGVVAVVVAYQRGFRSWALSAFGSLLGAGILVGGLVLATRSSWDLLRYYPAKALWTSSVVVIPLAAAGLVWMVGNLARRAADFSPPSGAVMRGALALVLGVTLIGCLGRGTAYPPHLVTIADGQVGVPNWSLALIETMGDRVTPASAHEGAIVFGLVPSAGQGSVRGGFVGMVDYMGMESLRFIGVDGADVAPVKSGLARRSMTEVCRYLMDYPRSLRITGPNLAAGPTWILESGCPEEIVRPERWISLAIDPVWFERSPWEDGKWDFPTFDVVGVPRVRV